MTDFIWRRLEPGWGKKVPLLLHEPYICGHCKKKFDFIEEACKCAAEHLEHNANVYALAGALVIPRAFVVERTAYGFLDTVSYGGTR